MLTRRYKPSPRLILFATFGVTSVLNYAFALLMGWLLAPGAYGLLAFAQAVLLVGAMILHSGFTWSLTRAVVKTNGPHARDAFVRGALLGNLLLATAIGVILVALFAAGPLRGGFERWHVAIVVALYLPLISLVAIVRGYLQGTERFGTIASLGLIEIVCKTLSGAGLVLLGFGAFGAIAGFLVGAVCAAALGIRKLTRSFDVRLRGRLSAPDLSVSLAMFGALLGLSMLLTLDVAGLKLLSPESTLVGYYQAGLVLANAPYYLVVSAMLPVLFVQLARYETVSATQGTLAETLRLSVALISPFEIALMAFPRRALVTFFPDVYAAGAPTLRLLAIGNILLIMAAIFSATFQAVGRARIPALILLGVICVEPFALWVAVPSWHAVGAAWVFTAAAFLTLFLLIAAYLRETGAARLRGVVSWIIRYILAVGTGLAAGSLTLDLGVGLAVAAGGVCYLIVATLMRIIRPRAMLPVGISLRKPATSGKK